MDEPLLRVINLGWGVQSFALAAMSALGELEPVDFAIHADTTWEHEVTYQFAERWTEWLEDRGVPVVTVQADLADLLPKQAGIGIDIPAFTLAHETGKAGLLNRACTSRWKIGPIRCELRRQVLRAQAEAEGVDWSAVDWSDPMTWPFPPPWAPVPGLAVPDGTVEQWLGISLDEFQRARSSDVGWVINRHPLLERHMTRADCVSWLERHGLEVPPKSGCVQCPYTSKKRWAELKSRFVRGEPAGEADWLRAQVFDAAIRWSRPGHRCYVHPARKPLEHAIVIAEDFGATQLAMFEEEESPCDSGHCFA